MIKEQELQKLIKRLTKNQNFLSEVKNCVKQCQQDSSVKSESSTVEFAFEKANKYPWSVTEGSLPIEGTELINGISEMIYQVIDHNLHSILNKQFVNVTNEIMVMRDEINVFTKEQLKRSDSQKEQLWKEIEAMKKKMNVQQSLSSSVRDQSRHRVIGNLNSSSSTVNKGEQTSLAHEVHSLRKQVEMLKKNSNSEDILNELNDKIVCTTQKLSNQLINLKIKIEVIKQKSQKSHEQLSIKIDKNSSKTLIESQVKRNIKSSLKVYLEEINACKWHRNRLEQMLNKNHDRLQDYFSGQLKSVWMLINNMKRRVEEIEEQANISNQSFILQ